MAMKVDRPAGGTGDDVVAFVARSLDEARAARDALVGAGVACEMPDAALVALFASGTTSVPVRVSSRDLVRALDVIDARFPPPEEVDLPPPPVAPVATRPSGDADQEQDDARAPGPEDPRLDEAARKSQGGRLERTSFKVAAIALGSVLIPGAGALFALFAVLGASWCLSRARLFPDASPRVRRRAGVALAVGLMSFVGNVALAVTWWASRG